MIAGIILIFAVPMIVAALLISPTAIHNLIHGLPLYALVGLVIPIVGWRSFLIDSRSRGRQIPGWRQS
jgi:hypothetical protein